MVRGSDARIRLGTAHAALPAGGTPIVYETLIYDERSDRVEHFVGPVSTLIATK